MSLAKNPSSGQQKPFRASQEKTAYTTDSVEERLVTFYGRPIEKIGKILGEENTMERSQEK